VVSFLSRKIDFEGNEARLIRNTIFSAAVLAALVIPFLLAFSKEYPFAKVVLSNVGMLLIVSLIMSVYFGPRLVRFHWHPDPKYSNINTNKKGSRLLGPIDI